LTKKVKISVPSLHHLVNASTSDLQWNSNALQHCSSSHGQLLSDIKDANIYIDDVVAFSNDWDYHVNLLATIRRQLREIGFTINPLKCEWAVKETDWLGYWLTPQGLKPWKKKIGAILRMDCPCSTRELCLFIGCVNYYCDMWPSCAHVQKQLTDQFGLKKKAPIKWTDEMQKAFYKMHLLMAADALAAYPNHNERFVVYVGYQTGRFPLPVMPLTVSVRVFFAFIFGNVIFLPVQADRAYGTEISP
jgi:hypothetical protein